MIRRLINILLFSMLCGVVSADVLRVPLEYATIQDALDVLSANDTVLVDSGVYVEELYAPDFSFVMMGNVGDDASGAIRPIIDPSGLSGPRGRGCMVLQSGLARIRNFVLRNGAAMYPHMENDVGGISLGRANLTMSNCLFDSVHYGVIGYASISEHTVRLDSCEFVNSSCRCVQASTILAEACKFHSDTINWAQLTFSSNSIINNCSFSGGFRGGNVLLGSGWNIRISNCRFSDFEFAPASTIVVLGVGLSEITDNIFFDFPNCQSVLGISNRCEYGPNIIRGNRFENLNTPPDYSYLTTTCLSVNDFDDTVECDTTLIYDNVFVDCHTGTGASGMSIRGRCVVTHNRFERLSSTNFASAVRIGESDYTFRDNYFLGNDVAVSPDGINFTVNAEWNYWGHESGPYHPLLNPMGQGDAVADSVDFNPWHQDTLFWTSVENERPVVSSMWHLLTLYPTPFNNDFRMEIAGFTRDDFTVKLYDLLGREVAMLHQGSLAVGTIHFTAPPTLSSGIYFVKASDRIQTETMKVVLLK